MKLAFMGTLGKKVLTKNVLSEITQTSNNTSYVCAVKVIPPDNSFCSIRVYKTKLNDPAGKIQDMELSRDNFSGMFEATGVLVAPDTIISAVTDTDGVVVNISGMVNQVTT